MSGTEVDGLAHVPEAMLAPIDEADAAERPGMTPGGLGQENLAGLSQVRNPRGDVDGGAEPVTPSLDGGPMVEAHPHLGEAVLRSDLGDDREREADPLRRFGVR